MATKTYNIQFTPPAGSNGTMIEYRDATTTAWVTPTFPANPTLNQVYPLTLTAGVTYNVRVSSINVNCTSYYRYLDIIVPGAGSCCPTGYTLSMDGSYCYQQQTIAATPPTNAQNAVATTFTTYTSCGSYIYTPGYHMNGTGASTVIDVTNPFWRNSGTLCGSNGNYTDGPLNRCGVWAPTPLDNQQIGFSTCVTITTAKQYYVGFGTDNSGTLKIDGTVVIQQDPLALDTQYGTTGGESAFRIWHLYPVSLSAGSHIIEVIGINGAVPGDGGTNPASIGAEIYDNTEAELRAATSYAGLNLVLSTKDYIGQPIQMGTGGVGYTCPDGYSLTCGAPFSCQRTLTTNVISC